MSDIPASLELVDGGLGVAEYQYRDADGATADVWINRDGTVSVSTDEQPGGTVAAAFPAEVLEWLAAQARAQADAGSEPVVALVTPVGENGRLLPDSMVTVNGRWWPVPEQYGTVMWMHRVGRTLRDMGWSVTGEARPSAEPDVYEVPVKRIETNEN